MKKSVILFWLFSLGLLVLFSLVFGQIWIRFSPVIGTAQGWIIQLSIVFFILLPFALVSAKKLTEHFVPGSEG
ncbi:hypothetical protein CR205_02335 [Alteribacter lacisalsi]|uniref:DUF2798 domain-containing protein n=1 Tax=Alteribacter lacisalsi TaxID=2045244 RepID=A0A2W0H9K7_9BACI|nr:hypothetical protein [Alteribacter lacisalsi]PYZ97456.1 hypothetical protein CR205_02335 [Alteribacter lacisalsi]